jgi:hypothetical protein
MPLYRHGDVLLTTIPSIPDDARPLGGNVLVRGEATGHAHRIEDPRSVELYRSGDFLYVRVLAAHAALVHEEHARIDLPRGTYRVWQQREYAPGAIRRVID